MTKYKAEDLKLVYNSFFQPGKHEDAIRESQVREMNEIYERGREVVNDLKIFEQRGGPRMVRSENHEFGKEQLKLYLKEKRVRSLAGTLDAIRESRVLDDLVTHYLSGAEGGCQVKINKQ